MKQFLFLVSSLLLLTSCEDVIDVDLNDAKPRLVVEANISIRPATGAVFSTVKLTTTAPFFDNNIPVVEDATIYIMDESGTLYPFVHSEEGYYNGDFLPQPNNNYTLHIKYKDEIYTATTHLVSSPELEYVEQKNDGGFLGDQIELKAFFTDPIDQKNFYYYIGSSKRGVARDVLSDEFFNGNRIFAMYLADDLSAGDNVQFTLSGVTEEFYNYMFILLQQTGSGGGPFETQPATVRGNIINQTNPENYPLGYFRISEISVLEYIVQ
ncbi:DUF4249 domain-containing protein [Aequorivita sp. H23M31]|uniref:DUF4249 domain-containing protein n=1 Tax=Aequorivita ciconiae TaxID=2494375 RepID=A0A410G1Q4_9FLAO|nr:DUF4249 domain-containing protein [Aequorivita sp. H23M31]QAA81192.1 DUF4249 domain-containing protein [Aequorivita sp. H23M31]